MSNLLIYTILCLFVDVFEHVFAFFKFVRYFFPACCSVIAFFQGFCFCNHCLKFCCVWFLNCWFYNIGVCCLELYCVVLISKCIYSQCPVSGSIISFRKLATQRFCQTKLNTIRFVHPVICCKFSSISLKCVCVSAVISIISPLNSLHCGTKISIS